MDFKKQLDRRREEGNWRRLTLPLEVDFASNDYLGFARCPSRRHRLIKAWQQAPQPFCGATGSRLLTGSYSQFDELESQIAAFHAAETCLVFNSGYCANVGLLSCIAGVDDVFLYDSHIHASSIDGMRLSRARRKFAWRHNDIGHLEKRLRMLAPRGDVFVVVESVYSCDGSMAPLNSICELCDLFGVKLIIDEAHATGIFGENGAGVAHSISGHPSILARMHTFSKALGSFGAAVLGTQELKEYLINFSRAFTYATALPLQVLLSVKNAYEEMPLAESKRHKLKALVKYFRTSMCAHQCSLMLSETQIQSLIVSGSTQARNLEKTFANQGFDVRALCPPTVPSGSERLRFCLHSFNSEEQIDRMIQILKDTELFK